MDNQDQFLKHTKLPQKKHMILIQDQDFEKLKETLNPDELEIVRKIKEVLEKYSLQWKSPDKNFHFGLPPCYYDFNDEIFHIDLPEFNEPFNGVKLNQQQLVQIYQNGNFEVQSLKFENNYLWEISPLLFEGRQNTKEKLLVMCGLAHSYFIKITRLYSINKSIYMLNEFKFYSTNFWSSLFQIPAIIIDLSNLIYGIPQYYCKESNQNALVKSINEQKYQSIDRSEYPLSVALSEAYQELLYEDKKLYEIHQKEVSKNTKIFNQIKKKLDEQWNDYRNELMNKIEDIPQDRYVIEIQKIDSQKADFYEKNFLDESQDLSENIREGLLKKFKVMKIMIQIDNEIQRDKKQKLSSLLPTIKKENPYLYNVDFWLHHEQKIRTQKINKEFDEKFDHLLIQKLLQENLLEFVNLYTHSKRIYDEKIKDKFFRKNVFEQNQIPYKNLIPKYQHEPREVISDKTSNEVIYQYRFQGTQYIEINTECHLHLLKYYFYEIREGCKYVFFTFIKLMWNSEFGVKGLFKTDYYFNGYSVNEKTGQVSNDQDKQTPIIKKIKNCFYGIKKSREEFESSPDNALFGKKVSRIFNLIECYLFRFLIVGIFTLMILHPIFNVFFILLTFAITVCTIPINMFVFQIKHFFRILIYNYLCEHQDYESKHLKYRDRRYKLGILCSNLQWFPIIQIILRFFYFMIVQMLHVLMLTVVYPIFILLIYISGVLRYSLRYIYDSITFKFIQFLAKIPERDSAQAKKIAGPGVSKNMFYSLKLEDSIQLGLVELEKLRLEKFREKISQVLNRDSDQLNENANKIFSNFLQNFKFKIDPKKHIQQYTNILNKEIEERLKNLKFIYNKIDLYKIKFTKEEMEKIKLSMQELLRNNLKEYQLDDFIWKYFNVKQGHFVRLTSLFLQRLFQENNLEMKTVEGTEKQLILQQDNLKEKSIFKKRKIFSNTIKGNVLLVNYVPQMNEQKVIDIFINHADFQMLLNNIKDTNEITYSHLQFNLNKISNVKECEINDTIISEEKNLI